MDDANIVPLLVSNTTYWWNSRKSFMSLRMHHMMDVARDYLIGKCSYITQYKTLMERESYCNFLDTEGYQILGQIGSSE
jgi:hypothetical protein